MFNDHINWDSKLDPPYDAREDAIEYDELGRACLDGVPLDEDEIDTSFVEMEDEEIRALIETEPK